MNQFCCWSVAIVLALGGSWLSASEPAKLSTVEAVPAAISQKIQAELNPKGQRVQIGDRPVCTIWLLKEIPFKSDFKPTLAVKYPLVAGQLIAVMEVAPNSEFTDFRGQEISAGFYTLRYGQQPVDGNHVGTSELSDFLLACPARLDEDPAGPKDLPSIFKLSAKATGSNHPAIFSLLPPKPGDKSPALIEDSSKEQWIFTVSPGGKSGDKTLPLPLRLIVIGRSEG